MASDEREPTLVSGKWIIVVLAALGLAGAAGSFFYYQRVQRRPLEFWGIDAATLIVRAPRVEALELRPAGEEGSESIHWNGETYEIATLRDVSSAPGLSHIRQGLVNDASFDWEAVERETVARTAHPPTAGAADGKQAAAGQFSHALRFTSDEGSATVLFDFAQGRVAIAGTDRAVSFRLVEKPDGTSTRPAAKGIEAFVREQFALGKRPAAAAEQTEDR